MGNLENLKLKLISPNQRRLIGYSNIRT